jgi:phage terminase large subunit GpA-like protein
MVSTATLTKRTTLSELNWFVQASRAPKLRTMRQFAEQSIIIPDGPFKNQRFNCDRQPYAGVYLDLVDALLWNRIAATGPSQTGKSFTCLVIPILYHLFETKENVIFGVPTMDMAGDKWRQDLLPAIEASPYRDLLPINGAGSKGGTVEAIQFRHGPTLRIMSGGGNDKKRAGYTARVLAVTEVDGMDEPGAASREADKITQMEARTLSYGHRKRVFLECTISIKEGRINQEVTRGTATRLFLKCPKCGVPVHPTRDSLNGWQDAADEVEAQLNSAIFCPNCGEAWSEDERHEANRHITPVHRGQEIQPDGTITGPLPQTTTLGFRWDSINNMLLPAGYVGAQEWKAKRAENEANAEKELRQFFWTLPHESDALDTTPLDSAAIMVRTLKGHKRGIVPAGTERITVAVDVGKWLLHWCAVAWRMDGKGHVLDYGRHDVPSQELGAEKAILTALRELRDGVFREGWRLGDKTLTANMHWYDSGYMTDIVYAFCRESGATHMPSDGLGSSQELRTYSKPKTTGTTVKFIGEGFHIAIIPARRAMVAEVHADHWKSWAHERLTTPLDKPGAMTLFEPQERNDHLALSKHLTAEKRQEEFVAGKGVITKWVRERRDNHWLDTLYNACAAGSYCGVRLIAEPKKPEREELPPAESRIREMRFRQR